MSAHNLSLLEPPTGLKSLFVAVDDAAGRAAGVALKERAGTVMDVSLRTTDAE